ncbi:MAG: hypothetical protein SNJ71_05625, partial [Bacteroidales bacterium]
MKTILSFIAGFLLVFLSITGFSQPMFYFTSPNQSTVWNANSEQYVTWGFMDITSNVTIQYSTDSTKTWVNIARNISPGTNYQGSVLWNIPDTGSENCFVRAVNASNSLQIAISQRFSIVQSNFKITSPKAGDVLPPGKQTLITWQSDGIDYVNIFYSTDNGNKWNYVNDFIEASEGSISWTVPNVNSTTCLLKVTDIDEQITYYISDKPFTIGQQVQKSLTLISPMGGETWEKG